MIVTAWEKFKKWVRESAWPKTVNVLDEWWIDIGEKPRPHFVSMIFALLIYGAIKIAVVLAA